MNEQLPDWIAAMQSFGLDNMIQVFIAALLGGLIGLEREWRGHDAGLRTNMLIAMGACLFTAISINGFPLQGSAAQDTARVAAQVVTGVGFLGAGAFIHTPRPHQRYDHRRHDLDSRRRWHGCGCTSVWIGSIRERDHVCDIALPSSY